MDIRDLFKTVSNSIQSFCDVVFHIPLYIRFWFHCIINIRDMTCLGKVCFHKRFGMQKANIHTVVNSYIWDCKIRWKENLLDKFPMYFGELLTRRFSLQFLFMSIHDNIDNNNRNKVRINWVYVFYILNILHSSFFPQEEEKWVKIMNQV